MRGGERSPLLFLVKNNIGIQDTASHTVNDRH